MLEANAMKQAFVNSENSYNRFNRRFW
jgi:hypothetical protein